ncbi:hypothetical protein ACFRKE_08845 [Kitasatospora indigofera]|uniref:hypothetical protein n=1 Tax=Kitasatospora indigofera TaxID=67307 RepID=UPI0036311D50
MSELAPGPDARPVPDAGPAPEPDLRPRIRAALGGLLGTELDPAADALPLGGVHAGYDSLAVIDSVGEIERAFDVSIDLVDDDLRTTFASVAAIETLVRRKLADQAVLGTGF